MTGQINPALAIDGLMGTRYSPRADCDFLDYSSQWDDSYLDYKTGVVKALSGDTYTYDRVIWPLTSKSRTNGVVLLFASKFAATEYIVVKLCFFDTSHLESIDKSELAGIIPAQLICGGRIQIMELCDYSLSDVEAAEAVLKKGLLTFAIFLASILNKLSAKNCVYGDLKLENILTTMPTAKVPPRLVLADIETLDGDIRQGDRTALVGCTYPMMYSRIRVNCDSIASNVVYGFVVLLLAMWVVGTNQRRKILFVGLAHQYLDPEYDCVPFDNKEHKYHKLVSRYAPCRPDILTRIESKAAKTIARLENELDTVEEKFSEMELFFEDIKNLY